PISYSADRIRDESTKETTLQSFGTTPLNDADNLQAGRTVAARLTTSAAVLGLARERKVRAPQDAVVGNAHRPKFLAFPPGKERHEGPGKCNRKDAGLVGGEW